MKNIITILDLKEKGLINEMLRADVHSAGIKIMAPKAEFRIIKLKDISVTNSNIIKQDLLSFGGEAATAQGAINHSIKKTDVIIFATVQQISNLVKKLKQQYFGLKELAFDIEEALRNYEGIPKTIKIAGKVMDFGRKTYVMGVLNVTPDSFSDGGKFVDIDMAVVHAKQMIKDGADIIDIGGESTRPGAKAVSAKDEIKRVVPVIKKLRKETKAIISIDTTKSKVAEAAIKAGAGMINDISGLRFDKKMAKVAARNRVPVVLMHIQGKPRTMQKSPQYKDLIPEVISYLQNSITLAIKGGVPRENIIVDPGFGFGKTAEQNLELLRELRSLKVLGCPILIGTSRKSTIGKILDLPPDQRVEGTAATVTAAVASGANIIRVHDVRQMSRVAKMSDAIYRQ
jgi:dihydropteroate synthase